MLITIAAILATSTSTSTRYTGAETCLVIGTLILHITVLQLDEIYELQ